MKYCTQNAGDCKTCSLVSYGRDCRNNKLASNPDVWDGKLISEERIVADIFGGDIIPTSDIQN